MLLGRGSEKSGEGRWISAMEESVLMCPYIVKELSESHVVCVCFFSLSRSGGTVVLRVDECQCDVRELETQNATPTMPN